VPSPRSLLAKPRRRAGPPLAWRGGGPWPRSTQTMAKCLEVLAITISICSVISSMLYTYVYVVGQRATFFHQVHAEYASSEMMIAFDTLEGFLAATGPSQYPVEYVRLKGVTRDVFFRGLEVPSEAARGAGEATQSHMKAAAQSRSEAELGRNLDTSRRRILHYFGKLLMLKRLGYVTQDMLNEFPGRTRAMHTLRLLEPLVEATAAAYQMPLDEHRQILEGVRSLYGLVAENPGSESGSSATSCDAGEGLCAAIGANLTEEAAKVEPVAAA